MFTFKAIGHVSSPYQDTSKVPKGLGAKHEAEGVLEITPEFELGLTDIEGFSHLFVIWAFDRSEGFALLGTPPSDNRPHGVFATRYPVRPNPLGLSVVRVVDRQGNQIHFLGADMLNGTPLLDIKPYIPEFDFHEVSKTGWYARRAHP